MNCAIVWFRRDLRIGDNPALASAAANSRVVPVYVHAPDEDAPWAPATAGCWWLHHSLKALDRDLRTRGSRLLLRRGPTAAALRRLAKETGADTVYVNRLYEPSAARRDREVERALNEGGVALRSHNAALLAEPWEGSKADGTPYRVFTAFWRARLTAGLPAGGLAPPLGPLMPPPAVDSITLDELGLLPARRRHETLARVWRPGSSGASARLNDFLADVDRYPATRDHPAVAGTSRLSPHLHFGEIGPRQVVAALEEAVDQSKNPAVRRGVETFIRQLGWREFAYHLLWFFPHTPEAPLNPLFDKFPWAVDYDSDLAAWHHGETGIPLVDAGMRELRQTGWMHNRVRMVTASLLTKNMLVPWQAGARWFWDTLVDADLANNTLGWQWVAGCGADAAPYFRILNPVRQGERFDPKGEYIRRWLPELADLEDRFIHRPWAASSPPKAYPPPRVDLQRSREQALTRFRALRSTGSAARR